MRHSLIAATLVAFIPVALAATPLTLQDAQQRALERSLQLRAQDARASASREMAQAAGQFPDPVLKIGVDNVPAEGADRFSLTRDFMTMRRVGVMQEWTRAEKRDLKRERYAREADRVHAERQADVAAIRRETAVAWLERFYTARMATLAVDFVRASEAEVAAADAAYRAGKGTQASVFAMRSAVAMAEDRRIEIERRARGARIELARWTGVEAAEPTAQLPEMGTVHFENVPIEAHLSGHPEIVALEKEAEVAESEARLAEAARHPDWTVEATYQVRGSAYTNMFSIGVSMPLPWDTGNRQDREAASKRAMVEGARARRDELLRAHVAEVTVMLDEWHAGQERAGRFARDVIPAATQRTEATVAAYGGGRSGLDEVMAARRAEFEARLQALQVELEVARLWAKLEFLLPDVAVMEATR